MSSADSAAVEIDDGVTPPVTPQADDGAAKGTGALRSVGGNALARLIALPISAVLGIVVTRLIIDEYGTASYGQYALLVGIGALLPFADLGISASIMNAAAGSAHPRSDEHLRRTLISCIRILAMSASVVILLAVVLAVAGAWDDILGAGLKGPAGQTAAALVLAVIGATLTVSFGQRILAGLGKYHWVIILNALQTPLVLLALAVMIKFDLGSGDYIAVTSYVATFLIMVMALVLANRQLRPTLGLALRDALRVRSVRGARVFDTAWPMLVQMIALPLAMQSDRIVISHVSSLRQLTEYSLAAQMFNPVMAVVGAAGIALWPIFARARADGVRSTVSPLRMSLLFGVIALGVSVAIALASGLLSELATNGTIELTGPLLLAFTALVVLQAVKNPVGMFMTDARGLRYQAIMVVLMLPVNLGLSLVLAERVGAVGPVIGSVVSVAIFQVAANWIYVRRQLSRPVDVVTD